MPVKKQSVKPLRPLRSRLKWFSNTSRRKAEKGEVKPKEEFDHEERGNEEEKKQIQNWDRNRIKILHSSRLQE
jgi:hypothetical protein